MTKKKHEELVEEIAQDILEYYRPDGFVEVMKWDREFAESLITLILSAVRDGRLELPDEVHRIKLRGPEQNMNVAWFVVKDSTPASPMPHIYSVSLKVGDTIIVVRPKEEK